jgi:CRP/FNR family transcriptional regulator, cyclic AMP receptor protein
MRKAIRILGILSDADVDWIIDNASVVFVPGGTVLIREAVPVNDVYILLDGELSVTVGASSTWVATLLSGEIVGEISFVDTRPPVASVVAVSDTHVLAIPRPLLSQALEHDSGFSSRFYRAIAAYLADRLHVTVGRFGYGNHAQDVDVDELTDEAMEDVSLGLFRMNYLLQQTQSKLSHPLR